LKIGATYEFGVEAIRSLNGDTNAFDTRVAEGYVAGSFGKVTIGKGSVATDGTFESYAILGHYLAGPGSRLAVAEAIGTTYADIDGGRSGRIRYDSPSFNGLKFAVSVNNGGSTGVMAGYDGKIAGGALRVRAGSNSDADYTAVSVAYKHSSGLGVAYSDSEKGAATSDWLGLSYAMGNVVLSAGTGETAAGAEFTSVGLNYKPAKGVEIYLNNASAGGTDDGSATYLGTRVKF